jgi:folate-binding protein YgfZ
MADRCYALNEERACLTVAGEEARSFLQGLVTNDVDKATRSRAIYAGFLTAQGRFLHDLFIAELPEGGTLALDGEAARLDDLKRRLTLYKLRAKATIADARDSLAVAVLWGEDAAKALGLAAEPGAARALGDGTVFVDPRLAALGVRAILPRGTAAATLEAAGFTAALLAEHRRLRLSLGVPEGSGDLPVEKALLLENGFEELNGVDFKKGCYIGQELTARMKYRALTKKRLVPVTIEGPAPAPGTAIMSGEEEVGELRSALDGAGLALLKLDAIEAAETSAAPLTAGNATLRPRRPAWLAA